MTDATDATDKSETTDAIDAIDGIDAPPVATGETTPEDTTSDASGQQAPSPSSFTQDERVGRGIALALLIIPAGIIVWTVLWNIGFIASIVSWGVALGAVWLYRVGSKARVTRGAFWGIVAIVIVTIVLSLLAGIFTDLAGAVGIPLTEALTRPEFWELFADNVFSNGEMWQAYLPQVGLALLFAVLGCFMTMRRLSRESRA